MVEEAKVCTWCGNKLVNEHWRCLEDAAPGADFETRHGYARNIWGAKSKHYDLEWYGNQEDDHDDRES